MEFEEEPLEDMDYEPEVKVHKCDICEFECDKASKLSAHTRKEHPIKVTPSIKCDQCDYHTFEQYRLKKHKATHDKSLRIRCNQCDVICSSKPNLRRHIKSIHEGIKPATCSECGKSYEGNRSLAMHLLREHNILYKYK